MSLRALVFALLVVPLWHASFAQNYVDDAQAQTERDKIAAQRTAVEQHYQADKAKCYQEFLVNRCLNKARVEQRAKLADLRRQEVLLNDSDRKRAAAEELLKIDQKTSAQQQQLDAQRRDQAMAQQRSREAQAAQQQSTRAQMQAQAPANEQAQLAKEKALADKAKARAAAAARAPQMQQSYNDKLQQAQQHKADVLQRQSQATTPPSPPLPVPSAPSAGKP